MSVNKHENYLSSVHGSLKATAAKSDNRKDFDYKNNDDIQHFSIYLFTVKQGVSSRAPMPRAMCREMYVPFFCES